MQRVAINGFGRIGRLFLRAHLTRPRDRFTVVAINDLMPIETAVHLLKHDSVHGSYDSVDHDGHNIIIGNLKIGYIQQPTPSLLPWTDFGIQTVAECSGRLKNKTDAEQHIKRGARKVLISAPCADADNMIVFGVNHTTLSASDVIISNASCTTNALAPIISSLHSKVGIENGFLTTIHAYTADQRLVDAAHSDLRRSRAAAESIIPTSTGAARAICKIFPELQGRIDGISIRVPTASVSFVDLTLHTKKSSSAAEINQILAQASSRELEGIMRYCDAPLVSKDFVHSPESIIIDSLMTQVLDDHLVKVFGWYDNEWGFSHRMADVISHLHSL